jgi:hypothetical protein
MGFLCFWIGFSNVHHKLLFILFYFVDIGNHIIFFLWSFVRKSFNALSMENKFVEKLKNPQKYFCRIDPYLQKKFIYLFHFEL